MLMAVNRRNGWMDKVPTQNIKKVVTPVGVGYVIQSKAHTVGTNAVTLQPASCAKYTKSYN